MFKFITTIFVVSAALSTTHAGEVAEKVAQLEKKEAAILFTELAHSYRSLYRIRNEFKSVIVYTNQLRQANLDEGRRDDAIEAVCNSFTTAFAHYGKVNPEILLPETGWYRIGFNYESIALELSQMHKEFWKPYRRLCKVDRSIPTKEEILEAVAYLQGEALSNHFRKIGDKLCEAYNPLQNKLYGIELCRPESFDVYAR